MSHAPLCSTASDEFRSAAEGLLQEMMNDVMSAVNNREKKEEVLMPGITAISADLEREGTTVIVIQPYPHIPIATHHEIHVTDRRTTVALGEK